MALDVLAQIWKTGATIKRLENGELELKVKNPIPDEIMKRAEACFAEINDFIKSVDDMTPVDRFMWNIVAVSAGWQKNENIDNFFRSDETIAKLFYKYMEILALNGWISSEQDWRKFETPESDKIKNEIFQRAVAFKEGAK